MPGGMTFLNGALDSSTCHRGSVMTGNSAGTHPAPSPGVLINSLPFSTHNSPSAQVVVQVLFDKHIGK